MSRIKSIILIKLKSFLNFRFKGFGFTLIELLISISIITVISSLALVNYRSGKVSYSLSQSSQRLVSDIRKAQNLAIGGISFNGGYCGYGIVLNSSSKPYSYFIYGDRSSDCSSSNNSYDSRDNIIEEVNLLGRIKIKSTNPSPVDILFRPPEPATFINQDDSLGVSSVITLEAEGYSLPVKTIKVNTSGLIEGS